MPTENPNLESACAQIVTLLADPQSGLDKLILTLAKNNNTGDSDEHKAANAFLKLANGNGAEKEKAIATLTNLLVRHPDWITGNSYASDSRDSNQKHYVQKLIIETLSAIKARYKNQPSVNWPKALRPGGFLSMGKRVPIWDLKRKSKDFNPNNCHIDEHTSWATCGGGGISFGDLSLKQIMNICDNEGIPWTILNENSTTPTLRMFLPIGPNAAQTVGRLRQAVNRAKKQLAEKAKITEGEGAGCLKGRPQGLTAGAAAAKPTPEIARGQTRGLSDSML